MDIVGIKKFLAEGKLHTPCYILDTDVLIQHTNKIKELTKGAALLCYAMKANPFVVDTLDPLVGRIEVCSPGELEICKVKKIPGEHIIFSGVNKTKEDIEAAFAYGVDVITLESMRHFELVREYCMKHNTTAKVLPRITSGSQFGMDEKQVKELICNRKEYPYLQFEGIHYFTGTQKRKIEKIEEELIFLEEFTQELEKTCDFKAPIIEYGAGLFVPYFEGEDFENPFGLLEEVLACINKRNMKGQIVLELGRFFTYNCGQYLTRIDDVKCNHEHHYALVDGGIHQINYYGQNMAMRVPRIEAICMDNSKSCDKIVDNNTIGDSQMDYTICGSLCTFADVLVRKWTGPKLAIGDYLLFQNVGAYSMTEAPALFLSRKLPEIYQYSSEGGVKTVRSDVQSFLFNC